MVKPVIPFDRFLGIFMPGALLVVGIWYLHRPFLLKYFPHVASDIGTSGAGAGIKTVIFIVASTCIGMLINQTCDIAIAGMVNDGAESDKSEKRIRQILRIMFRFFSIFIEPDPRIRIINRYVESPRSEDFLRMVKDWAGSENNKLKEPGEAVLVHQHIMAHMNAFSEHSRIVIRESYMQVIFSASLFTAFASLFFISILSFWTSSIVSDDVLVHSETILYSITIIIYCFSLLAAYIVKRRFRHFCSYLITVALHFFKMSQVENDRIKSTN